MEGLTEGVANHKGLVSIVFLNNPGSYGLVKLIERRKTYRGQFNYFNSLNLQH
jgi:hypothetical protein